MIAPPAASTDRPAPTPSGDDGAARTPGAPGAPIPADVFALLLAAFAAPSPLLPVPGAPAPSADGAGGVSPDGTGGVSPDGARAGGGRAGAGTGVPATAIADVPATAPQPPAPGAPAEPAAAGPGDPGAIDPDGPSVDPGSTHPTPAHLDGARAAPHLERLALPEALPSAPTEEHPSHEPQDHAPAPPPPLPPAPLAAHPVARPPVLTAAPEVHHLAPTPQPVPEQLVHVLSATRDRGDGSYRLAVEVHPAELGRVRLDVHVDGGTVHVSLHADHAATSALLEQSLDQLRAALESAGVSAGQLSLGDRGAGRDTGTERGRRSGGTGGTEVAPVSTVEATAPVTRPLLGDRALDVLL